jgi:hypothetical protein
MSCPSCGARLRAAAAPTLSVTSNARSERPPRDDDAVRFEPGHRLGKRYRIVALIGRGGMGEVYRADDLELGQSVALKFLPERISANPDALQRFRNEVRMARQVTHANVCRIHDIAEEDGHVFLIMEHVDGEDLDSLLRRIGRPSRDKAIEIARQLCAGVAAAHQAGVLHRDLKPGNVMLDGRGRVRITDFGLAGLTKDLERAGIDGTPAYMAPEQLAGRGVSTRSDVYSLGLVLYELFTGKRAHSGGTLAELRHEHERGSVTSASTHVQDLDPAIERVLERCLEKDPSLRPASAQAVLRALPGGDPLAEAIAAGETPSPELIAHAGDAGSLSPRVAIGGLIGIAAAFLVAWLVFPVGRPGEVLSVPEQPPSVLAIRADDALRALGWDELLEGHSASGLARDPLLVREMTSEATDADGSAPRRGPGTLFWRRWSVQPLRPKEFHQPAVTMDDPPMGMPGQAGVALDASSRLVYLAILPQPKELAPGAAPAALASEPAPDWGKLFELARLDIDEFHAVAPSRGPSGGVPTDANATWEGAWPEDPDRTLTFHAGARSGRPVYWEIDWKLGPSLADPSIAPSPLDGAADTWMTRMARKWHEPSFVSWRTNALWICAIVLAWRHLRSGRGDRRGAVRLGAFVTAMYWLGGWVLFVPQAASYGESIANSFFSEHLGHALVHGAAMTVFYLALEPYARRLWPRMLVGWSRLLQGRLTDPLVGRELLRGGAACAAAFLALAALERVAVGAGLGQWRPPVGAPFIAIGSPGTWVFELLVAPPRAVLVALDLVMLLLVWRLLLRSPRAAVVAVFLLGVFLNYGGVINPDQPLLELAGAALLSGLAVAVLLRGGLLAFTVYLWASSTFVMALPAAAAGSWARTAQVAPLAFILGVLALGAWISMAGRPILGDLLAEKPAGA